MVDFIQPDALKFLSIPIIAALVGWSTNWLAIKLMFYPLSFVGYQPLKIGWQGVIPSKAEKMAKIIVDKGLSSITDVSEIYQTFDQETLTDQLEEILKRHMIEFVDELMMQDSNVYWENLPVELQNAFYQRCVDEIPRRLQDSVERLGEGIEHLVDFEALVVDILTSNKSLLNEFFLEAGSKEFKFIVTSGFYFGFLFGLVQMLVWTAYPVWWVLPLFGFLVGYATNLIALKIIFYPVNPITIGPFILQGLFLKRQKDVSVVLSRMTSTKVLTINNILSSMMNGPKKERAEKFLSFEVRQSIDVAVGWGKGVGKYIALGMVGAERYRAIKLGAVDLAKRYSIDWIEGYDLSTAQAPILGGLLKTRMQELSPSEFREVLRPAFQEDEWKLILVGAVLGLGAGFVQLFAFYGHLLDTGV